MVASYPAAVKSFVQQIDGIDWVLAADINAAYDEIEAIETELGTDVAGSMTDLKTRLAVSIGADGKLDISTDASPTLGGNLAGAGFYIAGIDWLHVEQTADGTGIKVSGFDDQSAENVQLEINAGGAAILAATGALTLTSLNSLDINIHSDNDAVITLGDAAGADKVRIKDSGGALVASIDSDGLIIGTSFETGTVQAYTESNVTPDRAFDADTVAVAELADIVGTLIVDLRAIGLID